MTGEARRPGVVDEVQVFQAPKNTAELASSPNSKIATMEVEPGGKLDLPAKDSDEILVVLSGTCTVEVPSGKHELHSGQGFLIPLGMGWQVSNSGKEPTSILSLLTRRTTPYVTNVASDVTLKIPVDFVDGLGIGRALYAYIIDRRIIGISPHIMEEWNQASLLRMNCKFTRDGDTLRATLPERVVRWYGIDDLSDDDYTLTHDRRRSRVKVDITPHLARHAQRPS